MDPWLSFAKVLRQLMRCGGGVFLTKFLHLSFLRFRLWQRSTFRASDYQIYAIFNDPSHPCHHIPGMIKAGPVFLVPIPYLA